jgi:uncharacterized membrane protein YkoI
MISAYRFCPRARLAIGVPLAFALVFGVAPKSLPVRAEEPEHPAITESDHACLTQKDRRAEGETGKLVRLATAMHTARSKMPGTVVRARLCHGAEGLVYVLTVLGHDGKVARITIDAVKGTLVGGL